MSKTKIISLGAAIVSFTCVSYGAIDYWLWHNTGYLGDISYRLIPQKDRQQFPQPKQQQSKITYKIDEKDTITYRYPVVFSTPIFPFYKQISSQQLPKIILDARKQFR